MPLSHLIKFTSNGAKIMKLCAVLNAAAVAVAYVKKTINAFSDQWLLFHFWRGYVSATSAAAATTSLLLTQSAITAGQSTLMYYSLCSSSSIRA